jgi:rubrerythrin
LEIMDLVALLARCIELELEAAELYAVLARRAAGDAELVALWSAMADDERRHARKLATWRELVAAEPPEHRPQASGFVAGVDATEALLQESLDAAVDADEDEAFALALALEASELDAIYTTLLQASPLARFPDFALTVRHETSGHHERLLDAARRRCRSERVRLRLAILAAHEH